MRQIEHKVEEIRYEQGHTADKWWFNLKSNLFYIFETIQTIIV